MAEIVEERSLEFAFVRLPQVRSVVKRVFGCWHRKISLPFTRGDETYQTCVSCGARRRFDLDQWAPVGGFYYPRSEEMR